MVGSFCLVRYNKLIVLPLDHAVKLLHIMRWQKLQRLLKRCSSSRLHEYSSIVSPTFPLDLLPNLSSDLGKGNLVAHRFQVLARKRPRFDLQYRVGLRLRW